jgi:hypothetical protein
VLHHFQRQHVVEQQGRCFLVGCVVPLHFVLVLITILALSLEDLIFLCVRPQALHHTNMKKRDRS